MKKAIALFFFCILSLYHPVSAETISFTADKDTYLDKLYPDTNFGQKWSLLLSGPATKLAHGLLHFDLSVLPEGARITKAQLTILVHSNHSTNFYRIYPLRSPWDEDYATWNSASSGIAWIASGGDYDPAAFADAALPSTTPRWMVIDVTSLVSDEQGNLKASAAANGLLLKADAGYNRILSAEFSSYPNALTCHSCHGANNPSRDTGKSAQCAQCHSREDLSLPGEPTLTVDYEPMLFDFVQVSDTHIGRSSQQATNLASTVTQINSKHPAFVLFTGDLTNSGSIEEYTVFKSAVSNLSMPWYCVPGDNDIVDGQGDLQRYREQFGDDYYAFDYHGFKFIGLDNNFETSLDQGQREWLENELKKGKPEIIFAHKPLLNYQNCAPFPEAQQLVSLFDSYTVDMFMNGHDHLVKECILNSTSYIWCKNLSYAHMGDPYNLYRVYEDRILLYHVDLRNGSETFVGSYPLTQTPTLVTLSSLQAIPSNRLVTVRWVTESEVDNAGFNIYRTTLNGETVKLNKNIITAQGSAAAGAVYEFADTTVENRKTYSYQLEDIDTNGTAQLHGPITATPRLLYIFK